jgi:signal transduction histidine kinase
MRGSDRSAAERWGEDMPLRRKRREAAWEDTGTEDIRERLAVATARAQEAEERAARAEGRPVDPSDPVGELLQALEARVEATERLAIEAEERTRGFEDRAVDGGSRFRHQLGLSASRKLSGPPVVSEEETETEMDLRAAIARSLRAPLTRATGLTLSLQAITDSNDGKSALRQLSSSLRRLDQLAADLHDVHRIIDGSLPLKLRRTDLPALLTTTLEDATHLEDRLVRLDADAVSVRVDPVRARQIVEGMLDAAKDRTRAGAAIVVRVRDLGDGARVSVEDDNRTPATITSEMSLAVRLAELHGTEITVDGASFRVVFPKDEL